MVAARRPDPELHPPTPGQRPRTTEDKGAQPHVTSAPPRTPCRWQPTPRRGTRGVHPPGERPVMTDDKHAKRAARELAAARWGISYTAARRQLAGAAQPDGPRAGRASVDRPDGRYPLPGGLRRGPRTRAPRAGCGGRKTPRASGTRCGARPSSRTGQGAVVGRRRDGRPGCGRCGHGDAVRVRIVETVAGHCSLPSAVPRCRRGAAWRRRVRRRSGVSR